MTLEKNMIEQIAPTLLFDKSLKDFGIYALKNNVCHLVGARGDYPDQLSDMPTTGVPIIFEKKKVGVILSKVENADLKILADQLAPVFSFYQRPEKFNYLLSLYSFLNDVRALSPEKFNWIGLYFKESALAGLSESTDLIIGPYLGEVTEHVRIPIERGLCGLALREERVVNMADVHSDTRHIACSLKTNSELIIPLKNAKGEFVAELDIDSHTKAAFSPEIELAVKNVCEKFVFPFQ